MFEFKQRELEFLEMKLATNIQNEEVWFLLHKSTSEDGWSILFWAVLSFSYPLWILQGSDLTFFFFSSSATEATNFVLTSF